MFTHAERESAFGSNMKIGHAYYETDSTANADFNSGEANGYWHKNTDYASELRDLDAYGKDSNGASDATDAQKDAELLALNGKNEWSISSDIQGAYKVVASTDVLGTTCALRSDSTVALKDVDAATYTA